MRTAVIVLFALVAILFVAGILAYPHMPERVASHWNAAGENDGSMGRFWGTFLVPVLAFVLLLVLLAVPKLDPLKENIETFLAYYDAFLITFLLFFTYLYGLILAWNLGARFAFVVWMTPALALLFYAVGVLSEHTKRNYLIGFRTPWTLASDAVWARTHKVGGTLFKLAACVMLLAMVLPRYAIWLVLLPILLASLGTLVYSYVVFRREPVAKKKARK